MTERVETGLFMAEFGMHADKPEIFKEALEPHLEFLRRENDTVLLSATKYDTKDGSVLGFVWIIRARDATEAEAVCRRDPFWVEGLRTTFQLSVLTKAMPEHSAWI